MKRSPRRPAISHSNRRVRAKQWRLPQPTNPSAADGAAFALDVVGPKGKPIPQAHVKLRTDPVLTAQKVLTGDFVKQEADRTIVTTDSGGRLVVSLPPTPGLQVYVITPGFGPFVTSWSSANHDESIPDHLTAELEPGWSVGGIILDSAGKPVENATVFPLVETKTPRSDVRRSVISARVTTDAAGRWRFDSVPGSMSEFNVTFDHPEFVPTSRRMTRKEFGIEGGQMPESKIVLDRGLTLKGTVTDEAGKPIAGASIHAKLINAIIDVRSTKTASNGSYA